MCVKSITEEGFACHKAMWLRVPNLDYSRGLLLMTGSQLLQPSILLRAFLSLTELSSLQCLFPST